MSIIAIVFSSLQISNDIFVNCLSMVMSILDKYNSESTVAHRQRLVWKLSNRTLRHLRPTDKLRATLPTINETGNKQMQNRYTFYDTLVDSNLFFLEISLFESLITLIKIFRTSHESLGESYDSLSLSSEEDFEDDSEINMEQPLQNDSENCEVDIDDSYDDSSDHVESANIENTEEETQVTNECVNDMDVEY